MINYTYIAVDMDGNKKKGTMVAENEQELFSALRKEGLFLQTVQNRKEQEELKTKIKPSIAADFCRQMGSMLDAGVPMLKALEILGERELDPKKKRLYFKLHENINKGNSLSEAMAMCGNVFPNLMINMLNAGETSGNIESSFIKLSVYFQKEHKTNSKIRMAFAYPIILSVVAFAVTLIIFVGVLPIVFEMFEGLEIPLITRVIMGISTLLTTRWYFFVAGIIVIVALAWWARKQPKGRKWIDTKKLKIPKIGKLMAIIYTERFARTLSSLYSSGVGMVESIEISANVINNVYIKEQLIDACARIKEGSGLGEVLEKIDGLDKKLTSTVYIGEESGRLEELLTSLADAFDYDADLATQKMISYIEPVTIVVLAVIIGTIAVGVMLPLFSMYSAVPI